MKTNSSMGCLVWGIGLIICAPSALFVMVIIASGAETTPEGKVAASSGLIMFLIPTIVGYLIMSKGKAMGSETVCSACGNPVGKSSKLCPTCGASLY